MLSIYNPSSRKTEISMHWVNWAFLAQPNLCCRSVKGPVLNKRKHRLYLKINTCNGYPTGQSHSQTDCPVLTPSFSSVCILLFFLCIGLYFAFFVYVQLPFTLSLPMEIHHLKFVHKSNSVCNSLK